VSADDISDRCRPFPAALTVPPRAPLGPERSRRAPSLWFSDYRSLPLSASLSLFGRSAYISYKDLRVGESVAIYNRQLHLYACALPPSPAYESDAHLSPYHTDAGATAAAGAMRSRGTSTSTRRTCRSQRTRRCIPLLPKCFAAGDGGTASKIIIEDTDYLCFRAARRQVPEELVEFPQQTEPPYIGFGTEEDSIASFYRSAVPLPAPATPDAMAMKPPR
jgi:hypothetical protein